MLDAGDLLLLLTLGDLLTFNDCTLSSICVILLDRFLSSFKINAFVSPSGSMPDYFSSLQLRLIGRAWFPPHFTQSNVLTMIDIKIFSQDSQCFMN